MEKIKAMLMTMYAVWYCVMDMMYNAYVFIIEKSLKFYFRGYNSIFYFFYTCYGMG